MRTPQLKKLPIKRGAFFVYLLIKIFKNVNISFEQGEKLDGYIQLELQPDDYVNDFKKELNKYSKQVDIKGFRKGKVPSGVIKKMYGKQILSEQLLNLASEKVMDYSKEQNWNIIGKPFLEEHNLESLDPNNLQGHNFKFYIGYFEDFEAPLLKDDKSVPHYKIQVDDEILNKEIERIRKQNGEAKELKEVDSYLSDDILDFEAEEVTEKEEAVEGGIKENARLTYDFFKDEESLKKINKLKAGESIVIDFPKAIDKPKEDIVKNLFQTEKPAEEVSQFFKITLNKIERKEAVPLDKTLFDKLFPDKNIETEEDFRKQLTEDIQRVYDNETKKFRSLNLQLELLKTTDIPLPEKFIEKYLQQMNKENEDAQETEITEERIKNELSGIKWELIKGKILKENELNVTEEDVKFAAKSGLLQSMNLPESYADAPFLDEWVEKSLKEEQSRKKAIEDAMNFKIMDFLQNKIKVEEKEVTSKQFEEISKNLNDEFQRGF
ncbi:MAG: hypothetical protein EA412_05530 [Chitinophagaceae bacterium]|nr:MAG: hypothetical protein EA412_05530 [Chitinophagaceae bacterium]